MALSPDMQSFVRDYYGRILKSSADLKTSACCAGGAPENWIARRLAKVSEEVQSRFYGCGFPIPHAVSGRTILDLGCGSGRDVFILAQLTGPEGTVHGLDMSKEQLAVAKKASPEHAKTFGYHRENTFFHEGYIEDLAAAGFDDASVDIVVSNCVINLSPAKDQVLKEIFRVLKPGGEMYISDVLCDRRLPEAVSNDPVLYAECLGGAMYQRDFEALARQTGFIAPRIVTSSPISIHNSQIRNLVGCARFVSLTYRMFKLSGLDEHCEDYGDVVRYKGGIEGAEELFWLDEDHAFECNRPEKVCRNTAVMLSETRFAPWFTHSGGGNVHFGDFFNCTTQAATVYGEVMQDSEEGACC